MILKSIAEDLGIKPWVELVEEDEAAALLAILA